MTILDRMLFAAFIRAYLICLTSTLSLYVIVDLFTNIDDFFQEGRRVTEVLGHILSYYGYRSVQYYDRLCEALALLAAMFTVAWTQRSNELIPMLSAGVSVHRFLRPIFLGAALMLVVGVLNQEFLIPRISPMLMTERDDPDGARDVLVQGCYDPNKVHIDGFKAYRKSRTVEKFSVTLPVTAKSEMRHLTAERAEYIPREEGKELSGGWEMRGAVPPDLTGRKYDPAMIRMIDPGKYFLWVEEATFDRVTQGQKSQAYSSSETVYELMQRTDAGRMNGLAVMFHMRIVRPFVGLLLVVMGLSIILRDQTRHVFISAGLCLAMCAIFFAVVFGGRFMGLADYVSPALAAWLPVLVFGPIAVALYDAIHT
ncbi:MAG TPA: LptF/LptG family permease [Gemmataceae bacterium]|jgi:lipopolysaccharide export system permease protein|nr:LptF/LptG family permease [Gemmataceae bacterium]